MLSQCTRMCERCRPICRPGVMLRTNIDDITELVRVLASVCNRFQPFLSTRRNCPASQQQQQRANETVSSDILRADATGTTVMQDVRRLDPSGDRNCCCDDRRGDWERGTGKRDTTMHVFLLVFFINNVKQFVIVLISFL